MERLCLMTVWPDAARDDSAEGKISKLVLASQFAAGAHDRT